MKRSEMNDYIYEEIKEALEMRQYSNETDEKYWKRRSVQLLDMMLGFGMLPPEVAVTKAVSGDLTSNISAKVSYSSKIHKWEPEDE